MREAKQYIYHVPYILPSSTWGEEVSQTLSHTHPTIFHFLNLRILIPQIRSGFSNDFPFLRNHTGKLHTSSRNGSVRSLKGIALRIHTLKKCRNMGGFFWAWLKQ